MNKRKLNDYFLLICREEEDFNSARVSKSALKAVLPQIMAGELTAQQRKCLELRFATRYRSVRSRNSSGFPSQRSAVI